MVLLVLSILAPFETLDWTVQREVQRHRSPALDSVMRGATEIGKPPLVFAVLMGIAAFGGPAGAATVREAVLALAPTNLVVEGTKRLVGRTRPDGGRKRSNSSLPSSHAANAFALAVVFGRRWRRAAPWFWAAACVIAFSRTYLNRHFMSDVLVGGAIGVGFACLAGWLVKRYGWGHPSTPPVNPAG